MRYLLLCFLVLPVQAQIRVDGGRLLDTVAVLSDDALAGRGSGTEGARQAAEFVETALREAGLRPIGDGYAHRFSWISRSDSMAGANIVGMVGGTEIPDRYLVVTAHYDHLGIRNGEIYNGADDNASGTAALIELAYWFARHPTRHSLIFAALDAEESGLRGARAFVAAPPVPIESVSANINMDMVSRSETGELYVAGTGHRPQLRPLLQPVADRSRITLLFGHDSPGSGRDDWTMASDHGPFHAAGIPFLYFGVEDHADYHRSTDDFERITPAFFIEAVETILEAIMAVDTGLDAS